MDNIFSHLCLILLLLTQFITQVNAQLLGEQGNIIVIVVVVILIVFVGILGIFIGFVLCKITNIFGIFNKQQRQSRFSTVAPPPTLRPSSYMLPHVPPEEAPPTYDDLRNKESSSNSESDHLPPTE